MRSACRGWREAARSRPWRGSRHSRPRQLCCGSRVTSGARCSRCARPRGSRRQHGSTGVPSGGRTIRCWAAAAARATPSLTPPRYRPAPPRQHSRRRGTARGRTRGRVQSPACAAILPAKPLPLPTPRLGPAPRREVSGRGMRASYLQPSSSRRATRARWTLPRGPHAACRAAARRATRAMCPRPQVGSPISSRAGLCTPPPRGSTPSAPPAAHPCSRYRRTSGPRARATPRQGRTPSRASPYRQIETRTPSPRLRQ